ncbi:S8 family serine peptidase [Paenibacillus sp. MWE-103]|uniref:S8 family serine peptidase n=1 Tax=Paenibacillus artemisiicola TaxID=1172618 RepID=A0ABS3WJY7_9BACL|nr:S8 family serine peptidase [Paenibacillus artemisiicola]MBO7748605.1 S8 family serine peptidase [Paenibacillus artemisiicola]
MRNRNAIRKLLTISLAAALTAGMSIPYHVSASGASTGSITLSGGIPKHPASPIRGYVSPRIDTASAAQTRVIVTLSGEPGAVGSFASANGIATLTEESARKAADSQQASFIQAARTNGLGMAVNHRYNTVLNGLEVTIAANQIPALAALPGVTSVFENRTYYSVPDVAPVGDPTKPLYYDNLPLEQIGADKAWAEGYTGAGLKVGVIDTGIDYAHPDLAGAYKGGYDAYFDDNDPYEEIPNPEVKNLGTSHGTHVSGTIAGRASSANAEYAQKGVAYGADLHMYKVLGFDIATGKSSGSSAQVIEGIERAVEDGMDVINLSLGSDLEKDVNTPDAAAINNAVLAGVVAVIANGNAGPAYYTMGSPASSQLAISVGAATTEAPYFTGTVASAFDAEHPVGIQTMGWRTGQEDLAAYLGTEPIGAVYAGLGSDADYAGKDVADKVVLLSRGVLAFVDKIAIAKAHGAKAVIVFNGINDGEAPNLSDDIKDRNGFINSLLGDSPAFIPTFDMEGTYGRKLAKQVLAQPETALTFAFGASFERAVGVEGDRIADFSSKGPNSDPDWSIKPDVVAPGNNIFSTWPAYGKDKPDVSYRDAYNRISGTSMATPHVAGLALLLKEKHPEWTPFDVRAALANTAVELTDGDGHAYDAYTQGAGRVDVSKALDTPALLETIDRISIMDAYMHEHEVVNYGSSASFGLMQPGESKSEPLTLKNFSGEPVTYTASVVLHDDLSDSGGTFKEGDAGKLGLALTGIEAGGTITAGASQAADFGLTATPAADAPDGRYEGEVLLESGDGQPALHLPFVVHVGDERADNGFGVQDVVADPPTVSPNGDDYQDSTSVSFKLTAEDANYFEIDVFDLNDELVGTLYAEANVDGGGKLQPFEPGDYTIDDINDEYIDDEVDKDGNPVIKHLKPGTYKLDVLAAFLDNDYKAKAVYEAVGQYRIQGGDEAALSLVAKDFAPTAVNVTSVGAKVLTLPETEGYAYAVSASSDESYVKDNVLQKRPGGGAADAKVDLTVRIAQTANPDNFATVKVPVAIPAENVYVPPVTTPTPPAPPAAEKPTPSVAAVIAQGQKQVSVTPATTDANGGIRAAIADADLKAALDQAGSSPAAIVVPMANPDRKTATFAISGAQAALIAAAPAGSTLIVGAGDAAIAIPAALLANVPAGASLEIVIAPQDAGAFSVGADGVLIGKPVAFAASVVNGSGSTPLEVPAGQRIARSFTVPGSIAANTAGVRYEENGEVFAAASAFAPQADGTTVVTVSRPGFSTYAAVTRDVSFADIQGSWAQSQIEAMARKLLVNGTSATAFAPKKTVTRAEFAAMLTRALGLNAPANGMFADVKPADWFAKDVAAAYDAGIVTGYGAGSFRPNDPVTREQLGVMLARAIDLLGVKPAGTPSRAAYGDDAQIAGYAKDAIAAVTDAGIMQGMTVGGVSYFRPDEPTTRDMATVALRQLLQRAKLIE